MKTHRIVAVLVLLAGSGCGGSGFVTVTGKVTYQGQPVPSTLVTFQPEDGGRPSRGVTDDNGKFTLRFSREEAGVKRGNYTVYLAYDVSADEEQGKVPPKVNDTVKGVLAKYGGPKQSPLHYEVTRNRQFFEIKLE